MCVVFVCTTLGCMGLKFIDLPFSDICHSGLEWFLSEPHSSLKAYTL